MFYPITKSAYDSDWQPARSPSLDLTTDCWKPSSIKLDCLKGNMFEYFCARQSARSVLKLYSLRRLRNLVLDADLLAQLPLLVLTPRCAKPVDLTPMRPGLDSENWLAKSWEIKAASPQGTESKCGKFLVECCYQASHTFIWILFVL